MNTADQIELKAMKTLVEELTRRIAGLEASETPKITLEMVKDLGLGEIVCLECDQALANVMRDGCTLQFVHNQTTQFVHIAVKQDGDALRYVRNQTPEIALAAVKQYPHALQFVDPSIF